MSINIDVLNLRQQHIQQNYVSNSGNNLCFIVPAHVNRKAWDRESHKVTCGKIWHPTKDWNSKRQKKFLRVDRFENN